MSLAVLTFSEALTLAQATGAKIARKGWNGKGQFVRQAASGQATLSTRKSVEYVPMDDFMVLHNAQGAYVPWVPSQGDLTAIDWMELPQ